MWLVNEQLNTSTAFRLEEGLRVSLQSASTGVNTGVKLEGMRQVSQEVGLVARMLNTRGGLVF